MPENSPDQREHAPKRPYVHSNPIRLAMTRLPDICRGRRDLIALGRKLLCNVLDCSDPDSVEITLAHRAERILAWIAVLARPEATPAERRQANADLQALDV